MFLIFLKTKDVFMALYFIQKAVLLTRYLRFTWVFINEVSHPMKCLPNTITDPVFSKSISYNGIDKFLLKYIRDERDLPFIYFTLKIVFLLIPFAFLLFTNLLMGWQWLAAALVYICINFLFFIGRFALMFHCTAHRILFKKEFDYLNSFLPYFIAPFFGHMGYTFYSHHVGMHHAENNLEDDESTTMHYQRDSLIGFLLYLGRFLLSGMYNTAAYFKKTNRKKLLQSLLQGEIFFIVFSVLMCLVNWQATLCVFIVPYFFTG
jgi:fatty acid desaturase